MKGTNSGKTCDFENSALLISSRRASNPSPLNALIGIAAVKGVAVAGEKVRFIERVNLRHLRCTKAFQHFLYSVELLVQAWAGAIGNDDDDVGESGFLQGCVKGPDQVMRQFVNKADRIDEQYMPAVRKSDRSGDVVQRREQRIFYKYVGPCQAVKER